MKYKVRILNLYKHLLTFIIIIGFTGGLSIYFSNIGILTNENPIFFVFLFGGLISGFIFFFYFNPKEKIIELTDLNIKIGCKTFDWTEIKSYKNRNDSPEFTNIVLKTQNNKILYIGHRNKNKKDDFERFSRALENKINQINKRGEHQIEIVPLIWDTKFGKYIGYLIILIWTALLIFSILVGFNIKIVANLLIFTGISIPLLFRIFKKK